MDINKASTRAKEIISILCKETQYITIASIAEKLNVSSRTILRELDEVEKLLKHHGVRLDKKPNRGLNVNGSIDDKTNLLKLVETQRENKIYAPHERQTIILSELLQNQNPTKLYYFTKIFNVSEGTVSRDLDSLEGWMKQYSLKLIRKPGLGVYVEGSEGEIRRAIINLIYENVDQNHLHNFMRENFKISADRQLGIEIRMRNRLLNLIDRNTITKLEILIHEVEDIMGYSFADSAYVGLVVHLALAVQRIRNNEKITVDKEYLDDIKGKPEYVAAEHLVKSIEKALEIKIPQDEIAYITMHIIGSKNRDIFHEAQGSVIGGFELVKLARDMIKVAELESNCYLEQNQKLLEGLVNHLGTAISRLKMNMDIRNPLLEEIKAFYPHIMEISKKCAEVIEHRFNIHIPESEIGYIAMHLGAAIEKKETDDKRVYWAAVACPSGIGASRMLASRIENEYENIMVSEIISTIKLEEYALEKAKVDFVISTVPINGITLPVIVVTPLLSLTDKLMIDKYLKECSKQEMDDSRGKRTTVDLKSKLIQMSKYSESIIELLDHLFILDDCDADSIKELIALASEQLGDTKEKQDMLERELTDRESKGNTRISGKEFVLIHCRSEAIDRIQLGVIRLRTPISYANNRGELENICFAVIMVAPLQTSKEPLEVIGEVSRLLIEKSNFLRIIKEGTKQSIYEELSMRLNHFYKIKSSN
jgi:mannitol operon transcriptional antiterminator